MQRENWIDAARGFAIFLVVLGHTIQYATPHHYNPYNNEFFIIIYSFHMPLFMFICGYLFYYSMQKYSLWNGIGSKIKGIMVPCAMWSVIEYLIDVIFFGYEEIGIVAYFHYTFYSNWFLWAVFYCSVIGFAMKYVFKEKLRGYILLVIISNIIPTFGNISGAKRMFPFFVMGILLNQYGIMNKMSNKKRLVWFGVSSVMFIILMAIMIGIKWERISYGTYEWILAPIHQLSAEILGSMIVLLGAYMLSGRFKLMLWRELGKMSISIYMISGILFYFVVRHYLHISDSYRYLIKVAYIFGLAVVITAFCYRVSRLLMKNKITSRLFLGK